MVARVAICAVCSVVPYAVGGKLGGRLGGCWGVAMGWLGVAGEGVGSRQ